jgi:hypothetical protein
MNSAMNVEDTTSIADAQLSGSNSNLDEIYNPTTNPRIPKTTATNTAIIALMLESSYMIRNSGILLSYKGILVIYPHSMSICILR